MISPNNLVYWMREFLDDDDIRALEDVAEGRLPRDRLATAYLIARKCIAWDQSTDKLSITEKGEEALEVFK